MLFISQPPLSIQGEAPKKNKPPHGSGNHTAAIYEVKKMKTEDGLFEERNNLLREIEKNFTIFAKNATTGFTSSCAPILVANSSTKLKQESATSSAVPFLRLQRSRGNYLHIPGRSC